MGRLVVSNAISVNGAYEAPEPEPAGWLVLDPASQGASLEMWQAAGAMVLGRKRVSPTVWPSGPRLLDELGPLRLELVDTTPYDSGVVRLRYRLGREVAEPSAGAGA